jgi:hypothetical protein
MQPQAAVGQLSLLPSKTAPAQQAPTAPPKKSHVMSVGGYAARGTARALASSSASRPMIVKSA